MALNDLKPFSLSRNFFEQVVTPLVNSGRVRNESGLLELLKKLHAALWQSTGIPMGFSGAIGGYFQEVLDGYKFAVIKKVDVQFGSIAKVGGDTVVFSAGKVKTSQFKVTDVDQLDRVEEHIKKAAWQLTGAGGETPPAGSRRVVEIVIQGSALDGASMNDWKQCIIDSLKEGYDKQKPNKTSDELYAAVDRVKITTSTHRFSFPVVQGEGAKRVLGDGKMKDPKVAHGYVFNQSKFRAHWYWLSDWFKQVKGTVSISATIEHGVGTGTPNTPAKLPSQVVELRPLFDEID